MSLLGICSEVHGHWQLWDCSFAAQEWADTYGLASGQYEEVDGWVWTPLLGSQKMNLSPPPHWTVAASLID